MGNYSGAAGKGGTQQCFPKGEGRAINLQTGELKLFLPQSELLIELGFWPEGGGLQPSPRAGSPTDTAEENLSPQNYTPASCNTPCQRTSSLTPVPSPAESSAVVQHAARAPSLPKAQTSAAGNIPHTPHNPLLRAGT